MSAPFLNESPLQTALRSGLSLEAVCAPRGIAFKRHPQMNNLVLFIYDQIESNKLDSVVQCSRGCILDESNNWAYVARPFDRFFNLGEGIGQVRTPNLKAARVYKKEDGSLANLWCHRGVWHISTKGSPDAGGTVGDNPFTFKDLFWNTFQKEGYTLEGLNKARTYTFELCCLANRVVCKQPVDRLVLLAVRDNLTGVEFDPKLETAFNVVESFELAGEDAIRDTFLNCAAIDMEGYVVVEHLASGEVLRCKIKHPGYLALSKLKEGVTTKSLLELKRTGEEGEFLAVFPEYREKFDPIAAAFEQLVVELEETWERTKGIEVQKDFALAIKSQRSASVLFDLRRGRGTSIRAVLAKTGIDGLCASLKLGA